MLDILALMVVIAAGLYFVLLGVLALAAPKSAVRFLNSFAVSAKAHYAELLVRLTVGAAFLLRASALPLPKAFALFGWCLVITTACLLVVPWHWHRRFAERAVSLAVRRIRIFAVASLILGGLVLAAVLSEFTV